MNDLNSQIADIEKEIRETPYHKGTEHHIGKLRARLSKLKDKALESQARGGGGGGGYAVKKQGDATVVLIGPPSAGKSTLINKLTNAESKVAPYAFTTVSVIPGMLMYKDAYIQILDVPGLIEGAKEGKGRGKEVLSVARGADLLIIMTDVERSGIVNSLINELESAGIRINKESPKLKIKKDVEGGLSIHSNIKQEIGEQTIKAVAQEFGVKNGEITINEKLDMNTLIDAFSGSRAYLPALFVVNKIDLTQKPSNKSPNEFSLITAFKKTPRQQLRSFGRGDEFDADMSSSLRQGNHGLKPVEDVIDISAQEGKGIEGLLEKIWERLKLVRVYLVRPKEEPSFNHAMIMKEGQTLKDLAEKIGTDFAQDKKSAKIWGEEAKFPGQEVSLSTPLTEKMQIRFI